MADVVALNRLPSAFCLLSSILSCADRRRGLAGKFPVHGLPAVCVAAGPGGELLGPANAPRDLHHDEQSQYRADGDGEAREAFEEEGVGEHHEVYELSEARLARREARADDKPKVAYDHEDRDDRRGGERRVNRDVVNEVCEQEVEREERGGEEEVVHRMKLYAAHRRDDEHQEEEEEERDRREEAYATGERAGLQLLRHRHPDLKA